MSEGQGSVDFQQVVDEFLEETRRRRPDSVYRRYSKAMELLLTFLAVELLDPDEPDRDETGPAGAMDELTPELLQKFVGDFLPERTGDRPSTLLRHVKATEAFLRYLGAHGYLDSDRLEALQKVVESASRPRAEPDPARQDIITVRVVDLVEGEAILESLSHEEPFTFSAHVGRTGGPVEEGETYLVQVREEGQGMVADFLLPVMVESFGGFDEEGWDEESMGEDFEEDEDWDEEDEDEDWDGDEDAVPLDVALDALEKLDRFAPRTVVQVVFDQYDEARDRLLDWLYDDRYKKPGQPGEVVAHAIRILSEMGEEGIADRLLSFLGAEEPVGQEAPLALARLGPSVLPAIKKVASRAPVGSSKRQAALWAMGFMAARHPATRQSVVRHLVREVLEDGEAQEALKILVELRAVEAYDRLRRAARSGSLDLERHGYTLELLHDELHEELWGETLEAAHIPVIYLYPSAEDLMELDTLLGVFEDEGDWDDEDGEEEWDAGADSEPGASDSRGGRPTDWGRVIPFPPNGESPDGQPSKGGAPDENT